MCIANSDALQSDSDESDSENEKKNEDQKGDKDKANGSGDNTKGNNTPQGKKAAAEAGKKGKSLKRPGSPLPSDSSGTESTRKKKKTAPNASGPGSRGDTPLARARTGAGYTSDGEATGGEMSDGAGGKKPRPMGAGTKGSPTGSRAGSPAPPQHSRAASTSIGKGPSAGKWSPALARLKNYVSRGLVQSSLVLLTIPYTHTPSRL